MKWTKDKPTVPGWYFYKNDGQIKIATVHETEHREWHPGGHTTPIH